MMGVSSYRVGRKEIGIVLLMYTAIAFIFTLPIIPSFENWGIQDWDAVAFMQAVPRFTILEYGQIPLWNPYYCGGTYCLAQPQTRCLSPFYLVDLLLGAVKGIKVHIILFLILEMLGMYLLARHLGLQRIPSHLATFVFALNSSYSLTIASGMIWFLSWMYLPWIFLFYLKAFQDVKYALLSGIGLALMYFEGGHYPAPLMVLFLVFYTLLMLKKHGPVKPLQILCVVFITAFCIGAVKILPGASYLSRYPRSLSPSVIKSFSGYNLRVLIGMLTDRDQVFYPTYFKYKPLGMTYWMDANGMYIGIIPLLLFILGFLRYGKRQWELAACFLLFLWLSFGDQVSPSLWKVLRLLPVYDSMRVAQRFRVFFMICAALFMGMGFQGAREYVLRRTGNKRAFRVLAFTVFLAILADLIIVNSAVWREAYPVKPIRIVREPLFFQSKDYEENITILRQKDPDYYVADDLNLYAAFLTNIGTIHCQSAEYSGPRAAIPRSSTKYRGEVFLRGTGGEAALTYWSPNKVCVKVKALTDGYLVLNQNYDTGWKAREILPDERSQNVERIRDLVAVKVSPGERIIELYYRPLSFIVGALISAVSLPCVLYLLLRKKHR